MTLDQPEFKKLYNFKHQLKNPRDFRNNKIVIIQSIWVLADVPGIGLSWGKSLDGGETVTLFVIDSQVEEDRGVIFNCYTKLAQGGDRVRICLINGPEGDFIVEEAEEPTQYFTMDNIFKLNLN